MAFPIFPSSDPISKAESLEKWIRISPKKRGISFSPSLKKNPTHAGIRITKPQSFPAPPSTTLPLKSVTPGVKDKGKSILINVAHKQTGAHDGFGTDLAGPCSPTLGSPLRTAAPPLFWYLLWRIFLLLFSPALAVLPVASLTSPLQATEIFSSPSNVSPSIHPSAEDFMKHDGDKDFSLT